MDYTATKKEMTEAEKANLQALKDKKSKMGKGLKWSIIVMIIFVMASALFGEERVVPIGEYEEYDGNNSSGSYAYATITGGSVFGVENKKTGEIYYNETVNGNRVTLCVPKGTVNSLDSYEDKVTIYGEVERTPNDVTRQNSSLNDTCLRGTVEVPPETAPETSVGQKIINVALRFMGLLSLAGILGFSIARSVFKRKIKKMEN